MQTKTWEDSITEEDIPGMDCNLFPDIFNVSILNIRKGKGRAGCLNIDTNRIL